MEILEISVFSVEEKINIAIQHLIPQLKADHGLKSKSIELTPKVIEAIISEYTRESGVRSLSHRLSAVMQHYALKIAMVEKFNKKVIKITVLKKKMR